MSDKSATTRLPPGWTGTAPDADAIFAMAEAALETMPAVFKPHIRDVVIEISEFADDETLASSGWSHFEFSDGINLLTLNALYRMPIEGTKFVP